MKNEPNICYRKAMVIRFWNGDIMNNIEGVILAILHAMEDQVHKNDDEHMRSLP